MKNVGPTTHPPSPPDDPTLTNMKTEITTCEICTEPLQSPNHKFISPNPRCDHPFCSRCIIKYFKAKLENNIAEIRCPAINCDQFLDPLTCQNLLGDGNFLRWCDVLCHSVVMKFKRSYCPNRNCLALIIDECHTGSKPVTKSKCPNCKQLFCFKCMYLWHAGFSCKEAGRLMGDANLRALGVLAENRNWQKCPCCGNFVELIAGCETIRCRCGVLFCYKCGANLNKRFICDCGSTLGCQGRLIFVISLALVVALIVLCPIVLWCFRSK